MTRAATLLILLSLAALPTHAQQTDSVAERRVTVSGSVESEWLIPMNDEAIGFTVGDNKVMTNTYADVTLSSKWVDAGARFEFLRYPLPGFESGFKGWGLPNVWVKGKFNRVEITAGNFYEQFGSGFILRTYEERSLGHDNSLLGGRVVYRPVDGVTLKALAGAQRRYWHYNRALIGGADAEVSLDQWAKALSAHDAHLTLGVSWVGKHEGDDVIMTDAAHRLNLPRWTHAVDLRAQWQQRGVNVLFEWAHKSQDPSWDNGYTYAPGNVVMLSASYSKPGLSLLVQAKRSENMSWRSERTMSGLSSMINHLPAFTMKHTYDLPTFYPYATRPQGEWAYQAEASYTFKKKTALGGRYGTTLRVNFSHIHSLSNVDEPRVAGTDGPASSFWKWGKTVYYQDFNVSLEKKLSSKVRLTLLYINQRYNMTAIEGEGGMVRANTIVADCTYKISPKVILRGEAQYLFTKQDDGDWAYGLLELSLPPHWMITVADEWNCGGSKLHFYEVLLAYSAGAHRIQGGFKRTSGGYNCSGGVCRYEPPVKGFTMTYNYNF